jgi:hypothetical protein
MDYGQGLNLPQTEPFMGICGTDFGLFIADGDPAVDNGVI